jgi:hypothetical protein
MLQKTTEMIGLESQLVNSMKNDQQKFLNFYSF